MKIKLSKIDWKSIGQKMGWLKTADTYGVGNNDLDFLSKPPVDYPSQGDGPRNEPGDGPRNEPGKDGKDAGSAGATASERDLKRNQEIMNKIVDHNIKVRAKLGGLGGGQVDEGVHSQANAIVEEAKSAGYNGIVTDNNGMIILRRRS
jgi:hypothetical protein